MYIYPFIFIHIYLSIYLSVNMYTGAASAARASHMRTVESTLPAQMKQSVAARPSPAFWSRVACEPHMDGISSDYSEARNICEQCL